MKHISMLCCTKCSKVTFQDSVAVRAHLTVKFDVFSKGCVDLSEGTAESAVRDVNQIL